MAPAEKRQSKGKQKIDICPIEKKSPRQVTFSKRRKGMFKKASELAVLTGARVAAAVFSQAENAFLFGDPSIDAVLRSYAPAGAAAVAPLVAGHGNGGDGLFGGEEGGGGGDVGFDPEAMRRAEEETKAQVAAEQARMRGAAARILALAGGRPWWEADVEALGEAELPEFVRAVEKLRATVGRLANDTPLAADPPPPQQQKRR
uniref:MADS-box domain-containing protein n=1 Tax=Leersia perrieri TaxID=77586 RepID=A0A0D9XYR9_9ORYZ